MKLVHPEYAFQIKLEEGSVQRLIVENPSVVVVKRFCNTCG